MNGPCPNCGRCPTCGREGYVFPMPYIGYGPTVTSMDTTNLPPWQAILAAAREFNSSADNQTEGETSPYPPGPIIVQE